jgi:hypothetical protein
MVKYFFKENSGREPPFAIFILIIKYSQIYKERGREG